MSKSLPYISQEQLHTEEIIRRAFLADFGYDENGRPMPGRKHANLPVFRDNMRIVRDDMYQDKYWTAITSLDFFNAQASSDADNVPEVALSDQKARVLCGIVFEQITTAAANTDVAGRNPVAIAHEELLNARVDISVNGREVLLRQRLGMLIKQPSDGITGYFMFPKLIVVRPSEAFSMKVTLPSNTIVSHEWLRATLVNFKLVPNN